MTRVVHTPQQVANLFGISRETVLRECRKGRWPHRRVTAQTILFTDDDLDAILAAYPAGSVAGARQPSRNGDTS